MLSIGKLAAGPGAGLYYVDQVARGAEDYYAAEGEASGAWTGRGAASMGLRGEVDEAGIVRCSTLVIRQRASRCGGRSGRAASQGST